jgi:hypothetical protein
MSNEPDIYRLRVSGKERWHWSRNLAFIAAAYATVLVNAVRNRRRD